MNVEQQYLLLPGPTPVPPSVLRAMSKPMINHRGPEFRQLLEGVTAGIKKIYQTDNQLVIFPASGSGAMEAAVVNFISPGDKVLAVSIGVFGDRFAKIAGNFGAQVEKVNFPWGEAADPNQIHDILKADNGHEIKVVLVTHNETSTGVVNDVKAIKEAMGNHPALLLVDAVSGLGAMDLKTDEWNLDVVVSGSQKAFMLPPGLSFMSASPRAIEVAKEGKNYKFYWDLENALKYAQKGQTPYTPAISLFFGLQEALNLMLDEGLENIIARHTSYRDMVRAGIKAMGLSPLVQDPVASSSVTSVLAPGGLGANKIRKGLLERFGVIVAGGQQRLDDFIFRIGHLGFVRPLDLFSALTALEIILYENDFPIEIGQGTREVQKLLVEKEDA